MDKKKFVRFSSVAVALILIFVVINIFILKNSDKLSVLEANYYINGLGYCAKAEFAQAKAQFRKALESDEFNPFPRFALETLADVDRDVISKEYGVCFFNGVKYLENSQYQQALVEFENAIRINPNYAKAYNCIGNINHSLNKPQEAINYYKKALQLDPKYAKAYNNLGGEYFSLAQYEEAIVYVEKSLQINPNDAQNYYNLGLAYSFLKKPQQSRGNFQKAKEIYKRQKDIDNLQRVEFALKKINADNSAAAGSVKAVLK